ncbi:MAG: phenylacetate--CoA ligase family protein [Desulfobulbaceae bacterium]|nr:phenylacetate--CoA ligase family protein [Desulfobulbaceae bacterium]
MFKLPQSFKIKNAVPGLHWPSIPGAEGVSLLALLYQLEQSQWQSPEDLLDLQLKQATIMLDFAKQTVPYYQKTLKQLSLRTGKPISLQQWRELPILTRQHVQEAGNLMVSAAIPADHGKKASLQSSGSTGKPLTSWQTEVSQTFFHALTMRNHLWHRRDFSKKFTAIRVSNTLKPGESKANASWGPATAMTVETGPAATLHINTDVKQQAVWLMEQRPAYLLSFPTNLHALATFFLENGNSLPGLEQVIAYGEVLSPETRLLCREAWQVEVKDMYSAMEVGYMALQCPDHEHYHVMAENIMVEVIDENGHPCLPGELGRVVLTPLHNFAMPLVRYEIGDYAEVGSPCPCGRGLPVIRRVVGRVRNMLILPTGEERWPVMNSKAVSSIAPILQLQMVQHSLHAVEVRLVVKRAIDQTEEAQLKGVIIDTLGYPFELKFTYMDEISRNRGEKFEEFISLVRPK